jgi:hypothetical protein
MTLTERIHAASWWSEWEYPIGLSSPDVLESIGDRAEIVAIMFDVVRHDACTNGAHGVTGPHYWRALRALAAYTPWDRQSFDEAAEAVLEVCP